MQRRDPIGGLGRGVAEWSGADESLDPARGAVNH